MRIIPRIAAIMGNPQKLFHSLGVQQHCSVSTRVTGGLKYLSDNLVGAPWGWQLCQGESQSVAVNKKHSVYQMCLIKQTMQLFLEKGDSDKAVRIKSY